MKHIFLVLYAGGDLAAIQEPEGLTAGSGHCHHAHLVIQSFNSIIFQWVSLKTLTAKPFYVDSRYFQGILLVLLVIGKLVKVDLNLSSKSALI